MNVQQALKTTLQSRLYYETDLNYFRDKGLLDIIKGHIGGFGGMATGGFTCMTGMDTVAHEYVGHGLLGCRLVYDYEKGKGPTFQADFIDNLKNIFKSNSVANFFKNVGRFLIGYDVNKDGAAGLTWQQSRRFNSIGNALGYSGSRAWVSFSGSVPLLATNAAAVAAGVRVSENSPTLGSFLFSLGMTQHLLSLDYPWSAVFMSADELQKKAFEGHDFANVAHQLTYLTGLSSRTTSLLTAASYTAFVPAAALAVYIARQGSRDHLVSDLEAVVHGLNSDELKGEVERLEKKYGKPADKDFPDFFMKEISSSKLKKCKARVLEDLKTNKEKNWPEKIIQISAVANMTGLVAVRTIQVLGATLAPALKPTGQVLRFASPLFGLVSLLPSSYELYRDMTSENPKLAKFYSVVQMTGSVATAAGIVVGQLVPGAFLISVAVLTLGIAATVVFGTLKARVIRHRLEMNFSIHPKVFNAMADQISQGDVQQNSRFYWRWISLVHHAKANGLLEKWQEDILEDINFDQYKTYNRVTIVIEQIKQNYFKG